MFCQIQKMIKEQGTTPKRKGVVLLEAVFALLLMGMVTYGFAETSAMAFSQQSALKNSDKARQYADLEAEVLKSNGFENLETTGVHDRKTLQPITGQNDGYESTVTLASTVAVTPENSVKVAKIDVFKTGENTPRYSLEVPLSSQSGNNKLELDWDNVIDIGSVPFTHTFSKAGEVIISYTGTVNGTYIYLKINNYTSVLSYNNDDCGAGSSQSYIVSAGDTMQVWPTGSGYNIGNSALFVPFK